MLRGNIFPRTRLFGPNFDTTSQRRNINKKSFAALKSFLNQQKETTSTNWLGNLPTTPDKDRRDDATRSKFDNSVLTLLWMMWIRVAAMSDHVVSLAFVLFVMPLIFMGKGHEMKT